MTIHLLAIETGYRTHLYLPIQILPCQTSYDHIATAHVTLPTQIRSEGSSIPHRRIRLSRTHAPREVGDSVTRGEFASRDQQPLSTQENSAQCVLGVF